jgi:hypothetical protein
LGSEFENQASSEREGLNRLEAAGRLCGPGWTTWTRIALVLGREVAKRLLRSLLGGPYSALVFRRDYRII